MARDQGMRPRHPHLPVKPTLKEVPFCSAGHPLDPTKPQLKEVLSFSANPKPGKPQCCRKCSCRFHQPKLREPLERRAFLFVPSDQCFLDLGDSCELVRNRLYVFLTAAMGRRVFVLALTKTKEFLLRDGLLQELACFARTQGADFRFASGNPLFQVADFVSGNEQDSPSVGKIA